MESRSWRPNFGKTNIVSQSRFTFDICDISLLLKLVNRGLLSACSFEQRKNEVSLLFAQAENIIRVRYNTGRVRYLLFWPLYCRKLSLIHLYIFVLSLVSYKSKKGSLQWNLCRPCKLDVSSIKPDVSGIYLLCRNCFSVPILVLQGSSVYTNFLYIMFTLCVHSWGVYFSD
jgi:uncharacterized membrane protein